MKRILLLLSLYAMVSTVYGQNEALFQFDYMEDRLDMSSLNDNLTYRHFMGERIGKKLQLLSDSYTYKADPTPTNPNSWVVVEKPTIYHNVKKLERYYKKAIRKGLMDEEKAINEFEKIIDVALLVRYQKTEHLESHLESLKEEKEIVSVFSEKVQLNYY